MIFHRPRLKSLRSLLPGLLLTALPLFAHSATLTPLEPGGFNALRQSLHGQPFIVSLWSLDCSHCRPELAQWAQFLRRRPKVKLLLINTDSLSDSHAISAVLNQAGLHHLGTHYVFGDSAPERLRYEIDRTWSGELPRNYLFDAQGSSTGQSGPLPTAALNTWAQRHGLNGGERIQHPPQRRKDPKAGQESPTD